MFYLNQMVRRLPRPAGWLRQRILYYQHRYPSVPSIDEMVQVLVSEDRSIARFGDGEFNLCFGDSIRFQKAEKRLRDRLVQLLTEPGDECWICVPRLKYNDTAFWNRYWYWALPKIEPLVSPDYKYGNTGITRQLSRVQAEALQEVWKAKNVLFIYGQGSRFDIHSRLFAEVAIKREVLGRPRDAFSEYRDLLDRSMAALAELPKPRLAIISLGPTATVLAHDLAGFGFRALDVGHITNVYDRLMGCGGAPEQLPTSRS